MAKSSLAGRGSSAGSLGIAGSIGIPRALPSLMRTIDIGEFIDRHTKVPQYEIKKSKIIYDKAPMELNYKMPNYGREKLPIFYSAVSKAYGNSRNLGSEDYVLPLQSFQNSYNSLRNSGSYKIQPASYKQAEKYSLN